MARTGIVHFKGKSGKMYSFNIYPIGEEHADESGLYIFSRGDKDITNAVFLTPLYIGIAQSFVNSLYDHEKVNCAKKQGANCLCLHQIKDEQERIAAGLDLLGRYNPVCNQNTN